MTPYIEKASQKIVDIFFEKGAIVSRKEYDEVKAILSEQAELYEEKEQEMIEALVGMYEQYCDGGHDFMSAGEYASTVLESYTDATFDRAGRMLTTPAVKKP